MTSRPRGLVVSALGGTQILAWGSSYYLPAVVANPIATETGWPLIWVVGGLSLGLLVAGLVSPRVGRIINQHGGRLVLAASSILLALGLVGLSLAQSPATYFLAWLVIGLGMGGGLYDAGFATLGRLYGSEARRMIVTLTLFGGFASTVCWPFSAYLVEHHGWRGACLVYAGIHLLVALPVHLIVVPRPTPAPAEPDDDNTVGNSPSNLVAKEHLFLFVLMAAAIALCSVISSMVSVHLLTILQAGGLSLASAVALGAMVGPSQVGARVVEMVFGRYYHPIWTMLAATVLVTIGLALLLVGFPIVMLALILYGAGIGIESIARGTVPLALFGSRNYAALMGTLAMPSLIAQAMSPSVGAFLLQYGGAGAVLSMLTALAALNVVLVALLRGAGRKAEFPI
ncbi:MAG: MFS transporter [Pseudomonadota bacterium]|nr:MFS transporter [Pseudomonadota bacterium]